MTANAGVEATFVPRHVKLPRGGTLVVRPSTPTDVDGLTTLYDSLDSDDRYRRFFNVYHPPRTFFERMASIADRGGFGLVAVQSEHATDGGQIVGEASYYPLSDGDGEFAITLAQAWRGWLGPYLLDALLEAAAARGTRNLQAEVLVTNRPMLALLRCRGYATMDNTDTSVIRVIVGTEGPTPVWPGPHDRLRVLAEVPSGRWHAESTAREAGLQVLACPGPSGRNARCPIMTGMACPLVDGADAVVVSHPRDDAQWRRLLQVHDSRDSRVPICVEGLPASAEDPRRTHVPAATDADAVAFVKNLASEHAGRTGPRADKPPDLPARLRGSSR
jgi:hypothetical protein